MDWSNPLPFVLGGTPTDIEDRYNEIRSLEGAAEAPRDGIWDLARQVEATAIAGCDRAIERAFFQLFPAIATDALPVWEAALQAIGADTEVDLRALLAALWQAPRGSTTPSLAADLTAISPKLSIVIEADADTIGSVGSKYLAPSSGVPPYGTGAAAGKVAAIFPGYASTDILRVVYALAAGETLVPIGVSREVTKLLQRRLAAWQTWTLTTSAGPGTYMLTDGGSAGDRLTDITPVG